jgi:cell wall-associated NlpC family hydrolase
MKRTLSLIVCLALLFSTAAQSQKKLDTIGLKEKDPGLFSFVEDWLGVKYKFGGVTKSGIDCSAFTRTLYRLVFHTEIPRTAESQYKQVKTNGVLSDRRSLSTGDLVFFRTNTATTWHVGVYLDSGYFVHSSNKRQGVIISNLNEERYQRQFLSAGKPTDSLKTSK